MAVIQAVAIYFNQYGLLRGVWRIYAKLRSPVFRPLLLASVRRKFLKNSPNDIPPKEPQLVIRRDPCRAAALLSRTDVLLLEHLAGGGAAAFSAWYRNELTAQGRNVASALYNPWTSAYEIREYGPEGTTVVFSGDKDQLTALLEKAPPKSIFLNSMVSWPELEAWLAWLKETARNLPVHVHLHDYFCLCPTVILLDPEFHFCGCPEDVSECQICLRRNLLLVAPCAFTSMREWRAAWGALLHACADISVPHESVIALVGRVYPDIRHKASLFPGVPGDALPSFAGYTPLNPALPTTIAAVGEMTIHKGGLIVAALADILKRQNAREKLLVLGEMAVPYTREALTVTGRYDRGALPKMLAEHKVTVCLVPSVCPETYCFVMDELMALNMPVVCFDIGAQGAKGKAYDKGLVVSEIDADACLEAIRALENKRKSGFSGNQA